MKKQAKFGIGIGVIVGALALLAWLGYGESKTYYHTIAELQTLSGSARTQRMRVAGTVAEGSIRRLSGRAPAVWHNDHSRPEMPRIRSLREELGRVVRGRAANPRWIAGVMRHGYKGAAEIAATVDYLFAFAATSRAVDDAHFDALYDAYIADEAVRVFMAEHNPAALTEVSHRFAEAIDRGLWRPRRNSVREALAQSSTP